MDRIKSDKRNMSSMKIWDIEGATDTKNNMNEEIESIVMRRSTIERTLENPWCVDGYIFNIPIALQHRNLRAIGSIFV